MANPILDKITKLNAEIEQLRAENSHLRRIGVDRLPAEILALQAAALADLRAENERLRAEIERLRADRRERIATACLAGMLADSEFNLHWPEAVGTAIRYADALIAELDKGTTP